ncbi:MAG: hypothetical protein M9918_23840, partial [Anaerolineae bacterium]|nr:hypothetical protein [Anaerolineae bacterium]
AQKPKHRRLKCGFKFLKNFNTPRRQYTQKPGFWHKLGFSAHHGNGNFLVATRLRLTEPIPVTNPD